ncbi:FAD:protein FMN transferase [Brucella anthropi]|uniref:FAD:protein FMN transferase n=1 Tax=Brucella anthropi TaxID=529 RepID=A0A8I0N5Q2_BRUAN|nr:MULTISPECIES: FAD:protein FMN transferase [Brucella/Ochrobactrum group]MCR5942413.1 FAD:protein FMN transferase [Ochrobactrum sp. XJ1]KAB2767816.1 FAD:protein FMN transferase [Brucella anthropi]MBE0562296.1 FAD:protein FMN transferase [Brucella anthropi]MBM6397513.1 FAD:protein FMN transferase [Brucella anthropi]PQZ62501.1 FAD:protein FMN transferase [Ochrobactrum sp. MYb49]
MRIEGGQRVSRRLVLAGGAAGVVFWATPKHAVSLDLPEPIIWRGQAMGAPAKIILYHPDRSIAERLLREVVQEAERLENIFSLYREDSELAELNRNGALASPSPDLVEVLRICHECWQASDGLFDPTVQPLWNCLKKHFSQEHPSPDGPSRQLWDEALAKVGFGHVLFDDNRIAFSKPSMSLTLNGIAQGYVTDRVTALLQRAAAQHALVDMGEYRALGSRPDGTAWRIGIADLEAGAAAEEYVDIRNQALATSSFTGFQFEESGRFNHLLNPKTGFSAALYRRVTVVARDAARADTWATAFSLMDKNQIEAVIGSKPDMSVIAQTRSGERVALGL